ncbi:unnamed protein product [Larinioides sclopetarius]|uniref:C2H2-type domain-containing protein n=1 Tax=Larinioides sclopetarius TaxID=280406 RepID=A0AAV1ZUP2_9ARAC
MRKHTGERSFECNVCGKRFASRQNHKNHEFLHRHAKNITEKFFTC